MSSPTTTTPFLRSGAAAGGSSNNVFGSSSASSPRVTPPPANAFAAVGIGLSGNPLLDLSEADRLIEMRNAGRHRQLSRAEGDIVSSDELLFRTYREYQKGRDFRALFLFAFAVFALCFICLANRVDFDVLRSNYFVQQSLKQAGQFDAFKQIRTVTDFYVWLDTAVDSWFVMRPGSRSTPVAFVLVRQLRIDIVVGCDNSTFARFGFLGLGRCTDEATHNTSSFPAGHARQWIANRNSRVAVRAQDVLGEFTGMISADSQFEVILPFYSPDPSEQISMLRYAKSNVTDMRDRKFFDEYTAAISVDLLFFHPTLKRYSRVSFLTEQLPSRFLATKYFGTTFKLTKLGGDVADTTFAMDILVAIFTVVLFAELIYSIKVRYDFTRNISQAIIHLQHFLSILIIGMLTYVLAFRFRMWATITHISFDPARSRVTSTNGSAVETFVASAEELYANQRSVFHDMSTATESLEASYQIFAMALIPVAVKMLLYFQDVRGFNIIHNTLRIGLRDLLTTMTVAAAVLSFFALSGNVFFGGDASEFITFTVSFGTLTRLLVSADPYVVDRLIAKQPRVGALFFFLFFMSLWLVLLNFVLGIIVSGVTVAMSEVNDAASATSDTLVDVVTRFLTMTSDEYLPFQDAPQSGCCSRVATRGLRVLPSYPRRVKQAWSFQTALRGSVMAVADFAQGNPIVTREQANRLLRLLDTRLRERLFDACFSSVSATQAATESMEQQGGLVAEAVIAMDKKISEVANPTTGAPSPKAANDGDVDGSGDPNGPNNFSFASSFAASFAGRLSGHGSSGGLAARSTAAGGLARTRKFNLALRNSKSRHEI